MRPGLSSLPPRTSGSCTSMTHDPHAPFASPVVDDPSAARRTAAVGAGLAAVAAAVGQGLQSSPAAAIASVNLGVLGMLVAGFGVARRPKDSVTLLTASATAVLAGLATHPDWDSIRLMQWV